MEMDDEVKGEGNSYTTFYRGYDPRVGRWLSVDPVKQSWQSPYTSMDNNPIFYNDLLGDKVKGKTKDDGKQAKQEAVNMVVDENQSKEVQDKIREVANKYFQLEDDGQTFQGINTSEMKKELIAAGVTVDQQRLARRFAKMVNNTKATYLITFKEGAGASNTRAIDSKTTLTTLYSGEYGRQIYGVDGQLHQFSKTSLFVHELLGEAYYAPMGSTDMGAFEKLADEVKTKVALEKSENKYPNYKINTTRLRIIQTENLYNRHRVHPFNRSGYTDEGAQGNHGITDRNRSKVSLRPTEDYGGFGQGFDENNP
jgi:RHS repeat-associated protein